MARGDLTFDVKATDSASRTFLKLASAVEALDKKLQALDGKRVKVTVTVDVNDAALTKMRANLAKLRDRKVEIKVDVDDASLNKMRQKLAGLRDRKTEVKVDVDDAALDKMRQKLAALRNRKVEVKVDVDDGQLDKLRGKLAALRDRKVNVKVEVDQSGGDWENYWKGADRASASNDGFSRSSSRASGSARTTSKSVTEASKSFDRVSKSARSASKDVDRSSDSFLSSGRSTSVAGRSFNTLGRVVGNAMEGLLSFADASVLTGRSMAGAAAGAAGLVVRFGFLAAAGNAVAQGFLGAYGAVATTIGAIPGLTAAVGLPMAAVALGMDGIKKAAAVLTPQFNAMKAAVSGAFEKGLAPAMQNIAKMMPTIQNGMVGIARSMSQAATELTGFLSQDANLQKMDGIFKNVSNTITGITPGLKDASAAVLTLANQPALFNGITKAVNQTGAAFNNAVQEMQKTGTLQKAFTGLGDVAASAGKGLVQLVKGGMELFAGAAPGVSKGIDGITSAFGKVNWEQVGKGVGSAFEGIGKAFDSIPKETWDEISAGVQTMGEAFNSPEFQGGVKAFAEALPGIERGVAAVTKQVGALTEELMPALGTIGDFIAKADEIIKKADEVSAQTAEKTRKALADAQEQSGAPPSVASTDQGIIVPTVDTTMPVNVVPEVQIAQGSIAGAAAKLAQQFGDYFHIQVDAKITVVPQVQVAQGSVAKGAGNILKGFGDFLTGKTHPMPINIVPQVQIAQGSIAKGVGAILKGFGDFTGLNVPAKVTVVPEVEVAMGEIGNAASRVIQGIQKFLGQTSLEAPISVRPAPIWQEPGSLPPIDLPDMEPQDVEVPLWLKWLWQLTPLDPPPIPKLEGLVMDVPVTFNPKGQWGSEPTPPALPQPQPQVRDVQVTYNGQGQWGSTPTPPALPAVSQVQDVNVSYNVQTQPPQTPSAPSFSDVMASQTVNVAQKANVTPPSTPPAPHIADVYTTQTVHVRQVTITTASTGAIAGAAAGASGGSSAQLRAEVGARSRPGLAAGGVLGFAGGGPSFPRGVVLPGYSPGRDTVPAVLSRGEAVLVPELVKRIGPGNIMAANYAASRRRPVGMAAGGMSFPLGRRSAGGNDLLKEVRGLRHDLTAFTEATSGGRTPVAITVNDQSGNPTETARATQLALRMASI